MGGRRWRSEAGFTLIEVLTALAIFGLVIGMALPLRPVGTPRMRLEGLALETAALLESDRRAAMRQQRTVETQVDVPGRAVRSGSNAHKVAYPTDVDLRASLADTCPKATRSSVVVFFPDGMSCGGTLSLSRPGTSYEVRVNWLTGATEVVPHHDRTAAIGIAPRLP